MEKKETIFALSTPYGRSAIAVIRLSGSNSLNVAKKLTKKKNFSNREATFVSFFDMKSCIFINMFSGLISHYFNIWPRKITLLDKYF